MISFTPRQLYLWERAAGIHWIGRCVSLRAGLEAVVKRKKNPCAFLELNPGGPALNLVSVLNELPQFLDHAANEGKSNYNIYMV